MIQKGQQESITPFQNIAEQLADKLKTATRKFFLPLIVGALLAIARRRTVSRYRASKRYGQESLQS
jgi:hypothetical protein